jgi:hypothetical protein
MSKLIITVHGIRTFGQWQERLERLITLKDPGIQFENYHYGYFSVISFLVPVFRWFATRRFRKHLLVLAGKYPDSEISIISHSFGTHLVGRALLGMEPSTRPRIQNVILAGSVLKSGFPWGTLLDTRAVARVINDCGIHDNVLILSQWFVLLTGMAGRLGFNGMTSKRFMNRYFHGGHSHYFEGMAGSPDAFMEKYWVPILLTDAEVERVDQRTGTSAMQGLLTSTLQIADPVKLLTYVGAFWLVLNTFVFAPLEAEREVAKVLRSNNSLEEVLHAEARQKIDELRPLLLEEAGLPSPMQLAMLASLEWFPGEYIVMDFDRSDLNPEAMSFLSDYAAALTRGGFTGTVLVSSYIGEYCVDPASTTDELVLALPTLDIQDCGWDGTTPEYAVPLSERRARSVADFLIAQGIAANSVTTTGYGISRTIVPYPTEGVAQDWNRVARLNSRVDISLGQ